MKKIVLLLICLFSIMSFHSCGDDDSSSVDISGSYIVRIYNKLNRADFYGKIDGKLYDVYVLDDEGTLYRVGNIDNMASAYCNLPSTWNDKYRFTIIMKIALNRYAADNATFHIPCGPDNHLLTWRVKDGVITEIYVTSDTRVKDTGYTTLDDIKNLINSFK